MRPRIGITTSLNAAPHRAREQRVDLAYVRAVERAGGLPVLVPMLASADAAAEVAGLLDGLVVTGGPAVERGLVGARPDDLDATDPDRTASDEALLGAFLDAARPALGICYGMQLASALRGGTIHADAERDVPGTATHSRGRGGTTHPVAVVPGTHLARVAAGRLDAAGAMDVNTRHVQAVATPGAGLVVSARAPDGTVEAVETPDGAFVGVQFHPEAMEPPFDALFEDLVRRAADFARTRAHEHAPADRSLKDG